MEHLFFEIWLQFLSLMFNLISTPSLRQVLQEAEMFMCWGEKHIWRVEGCEESADMSVLLASQGLAIQEACSANQVLQGVWPGLPPRAMSGSIVLQQPVSMLMSVAPIATEGSRETHSLGRHHGHIGVWGSYGHWGHTDMDGMCCHLGWRWLLDLNTCWGPCLGLWPYCSRVRGSCYHQRPSGCLGELALYLTNCSTCESGPCTSPGQNSTAGPGGVGTGESARKHDNRRTGPTSSCLLQCVISWGQCWGAHPVGIDEGKLFKLTNLAIT